MKILITSDFYLPVVTGVANVVYILKNKLEEKGHDVRILTFTKEKKSYYDFKKKIYYFKSLKFQFYKDSLNGINTKDKLIEDVIQWNPDIIHSQTEFFSMRFAKKISKKVNCPIIHTWHTNFFAYSKQFIIDEKLFLIILKKILHKSLKEPVKKIIAPSTSTKTMITSFFKINTPITILPSGIDLKKYSKPLDTDQLNNICSKYNINQNKFRLITVSRLAKEKNIELTIEYFAKLKEKYQNIQYIIVGNGPNKNNLQKLSKKLNLEKDIIFCGEINPTIIHEYYKCAQVFISGSDNETQGLTYFEALASNIPIICKKNPVLDKILIEGYNGYSFSNEEEFINLFLKIIKNKEQYQYLSENSANSISEHSEDIFIQKLIKEYESIIY